MAYAYDYKKNISKAWDEIDPIDLQMGRAAYPVYQKTLRGIAEHYKVPFIPTVEAFVALSPNNDYHGNLRSLVSILQALTTGKTFDDCIISTYRSCGQRAWGYLTGEVSFLDKVKGRKITAFRDNILYLGDSKLVTVDGHMIAIACGEDMNMKEANFKLRGGGPLYTEVEKAVRALTRSTDIPPCDIQATLWTWRKRTKNIRMDTQLGLFTKKTKWDGVLTPDMIKPY